MASAPTVKPRQAGTPPRQIPAIPFTRASRQRTQLAFDAGVLTPAAAANTQLNNIPIPAAGFLRFVEINCVLTSTTNAATVVFNADGPFNAIASITLTNAAGDTLIVPVTGYQLFLMNKYGVASQDSPYCDPRQDVNFLITPGAGASGGSAQFTLRVPIELDPRDAFCAIANSASNKQYNLIISLAARSAIYSTPPTNPPTLAVNGVLYYWSIPAAANAAGVPQEAAPRGNGSVSAWRVQTPPVTPGDKLIQLTNLGAVLRVIIFTLRNSSGVRIGSATDWPATSLFLLNNDPIYFLTKAQWESDMSELYSYNSSTTRDVVGGLDTGVYVIPYFMAQRGRILSDGPRDQWLPTAEGTLLQLRGTSFGAAASTLEILTNEVRPVSADALYSPNVS